MHIYGYRPLFLIFHCMLATILILSIDFWIIKFVTKIEATFFYPIEIKIDTFGYPWKLQFKLLDEENQWSRFKISATFWKKIKNPPILMTVISGDRSFQMLKFLTNKLCTKTFQILSKYQRTETLAKFTFHTVGAACLFSTIFRQSNFNLTSLEYSIPIQLACSQGT